MSTDAPKCALYLRSSKDRHDVSIDAQRRALRELAAKQQLQVAQEYSDAVEAANDWSRPGFSRLLVDVEDRGRGWDRLLVFDTSRLARDINRARAFRLRCEGRGVKVLYVKIPDSDPFADLVMGVVLELMDHIHSMLSREKGLAGMAENVRRGFRAGGIAPHGYDLEAVPTGAVRDGEPVTKSRLVPNADAPAIAAYLKARAAGRQAQASARAAGLKLSRGSLVDAEWRALTYAGCTVWNQTRGRSVSAGGYEGGTKRRPRAEWQINRGTHAALISEEEAERILARLEAKRGKLQATRLRGDAYLLSGILVDQNGRRWHGDQGFYRCGRRRLAAPRLERQVLAALERELLSEAIVKDAAARARAAAKPGRPDVELQALQREAAELARKIGRVRNVMTVMRDPEAMAPKLEELVGQQRELEAKAAAIADQVAGAKVMRLITEDDVRAAFRGLVEGLPALDRATVKGRLRALLHSVVVDPERLTCSLVYAIPAEGGFMVASPRGFEPLLPP